MKLRRVTFELLGFQYRRSIEEWAKAYSHHWMGWCSVELLEWVGIPVCPGQGGIKTYKGNKDQPDLQIVEVQQRHYLCLPSPSLGVQPVVFEAPEPAVNPRQHVLVLAQLLPVACGQIPVVDQPISECLDSRNHWVCDLSCCLWGVHAFEKALAPLSVRMQAGGTRWGRTSKGTT
jgi:hypothetical protein